MQLFITQFFTPPVNLSAAQKWTFHSKYVGMFVLYASTKLHTFLMFC
jgi:hypothetical protein